MIKKLFSFKLVSALKTENDKSLINFHIVINYVNTINPQREILNLMLLCFILLISEPAFGSLFKPSADVCAAQLAVGILLITWKLASERRAEDVHVWKGEEDDIR